MDARNSKQIVMPGLNGEIKRVIMENLEKWRISK